MTNTATQPSDPVVCTLSPKKLTEQVLEWKDLSQHALTTEPIPNGIASTYPIELADAVEDLADREIACCGSWLTIETKRQGEILRLALTTPSEDGQAMLAQMSGCSCGASETEDS